MGAEAVEKAKANNLQQIDIENNERYHQRCNKLQTKQKNDLHPRQKIDKSLIICYLKCQ